MIFPSTADFREIVRASIPGCDVTPAVAKATKVIWGGLVLKMKENTVRRKAKHLVQSMIKVPKEHIKLQQDVELEIDCFFVNKHVFSTTYSTKECLMMVTHIGAIPKLFLCL